MPDRVVEINKNYHASYVGQSLSSFCSRVWSDVYILLSFEGCQGLENAVLRPHF